MNWKSLIQRLAGESVSASPAVEARVSRAFDSAFCLGFSQFNELMLLLGLDRLSPDLFDYIFLGRFSSGSDDAPTVCSVEELEIGVTRFEKFALLNFGNVKRAFRVCSRDSDALRAFVEFFTPLEPARFINRRPPFSELESIATEDLPLLGYIAGAEVKRQVDKDPNDPEIKALKARLEGAIQSGTSNQEAYLTSEHLDVYVATSMRERHEFLFVSNFCAELFSHADINDLNLRYFDPTLAYAADRIDKGLAEALMLKRANCTIFLAQESDTLGKDSELASTLAQGKTVIAFVPEVDSKYFQNFLSQLIPTDSTASEECVLLLGSLKSVSPHLAWSDPVVRGWLGADPTPHVELIRSRLETELANHYDRRAKLLKDTHPLGIQVHLVNGVAVGVLVVRSIDSCARLLRAVLLQTMEYEVEQFPQREVRANPTHLVLRESISGSIYRVMTYNPMLTNAFWNFYVRRTV